MDCRFGSKGCGPVTARVEPDSCICVSVPLAIMGPLDRGDDVWRPGGLLVLAVNEYAGYKQ